jgi:LacI family transcriptional regulator
MRRVAVIIDTARQVGRSLLAGISRYVHEHGPWQLHLELGNADHVERMDAWTGDGVIARVRAPRVLEAIARFDVPMVVDRAVDLPPGRKSPWATFDWGGPSQRPAPVAVEHLRSRGLRRLAFCGFVDRPNWGRDQDMLAACAAQGIPLEMYAPDSVRARVDEFGCLTDWLLSLAKPVGVWAANDERGIEVLTACRAAGVSVPDEVCVLGTDDDEFLCELAVPTLSSVRQPADDVGYNAAAALDAMMNGRPVPTERKLSAYRVVLRASSDLLTCDDPLVKQATQLIRDKVDVTAGVDDLVRMLGVSRRTLERRFVAALDRTPGDELRRRRVERAALMLERTELPAAEVAARCGFGAPARLTEAMRREMGVGPAEYRKRLKAGPPT